MYRAGAEIGGVPLRLAPVEKTPVFGSPHPKMWPPNLSIRRLPAESQKGGGGGGPPSFWVSSISLIVEFSGFWGFLGVFGGFGDFIDFWVSMSFVDFGGFH